MARVMRDLARVLGAELAAPGAIERLRPHRGLLAAAELGEPEAHVDLVVARIEAVVDDAKDARVLKLAALAHELDPAVATSLLVRLGVEPAVATTAGEVMASFWAADLWRAGPDAWMRRAGSSARLSLLFEVAHEGAVTAAMSAAAGLAGLREESEAWRVRLPATPK
jgi:hypothetical protein